MSLTSIFKFLCSSEHISFSCLSNYINLNVEKYFILTKIFIYLLYVLRLHIGVRLKRFNLTNIIEYVPHTRPRSGLWESAMGHQERARSKQNDASDGEKCHEKVKQVRNRVGEGGRQGTGP